MLLLALACTRDPKPDVVLILVDTLRADAVHYAGQPRETTPNLDAFVQQDATWFSRAYSATSWTLPSTVTLLTGLQPWEHRVVKSKLGTDDYGRLLPHIPTLASRWRGQGYRTGAWINNAFLAPEFGLVEGFDTYAYEGAPTVGHRSAKKTVDEAIAFLNADDSPAFMLVHIMEPHADYDPGAPYKGTWTDGMPHSLSYPLGHEAHTRLMTGVDAEFKLAPPSSDDKEYVRAMYAEEVLAADAAVGELLAALKARPNWEDTVVVVTADHGEELWDYGRYEHGHSLLSPVIHIPLAVKAPGIGPGQNDTVVGQREVWEFLAQPGTGDLANLAKNGTEPGRAHCHQGIIYGPQQAGVITDTEHLVAQLEDPRPDAQQQVFYVFDLDEKGREITPPKARVEADHPLVQQLVACRGGLDITHPVDPRPVNSPEVFDMLRQLGYIED